MPSVVVCTGFEVADVIRGGIGASGNASLLTSRVAMKASNGTGGNVQGQLSVVGGASAVGSGKSLGGLSREIAKQSKSSCAVLNQTPSKVKRVGKSSAGGDDDARGMSPPNALSGTSLSSSLHMGRHSGGHSEPRGSMMHNPMRSVTLSKRFGHGNTRTKTRAVDTFEVGSAPVCSSYNGLWTTNFQDIQAEDSQTDDSRAGQLTVFEVRTVIW